MGVLARLASDNGMLRGNYQFPFGGLTRTVAVSLTPDAKNVRPAGGVCTSCRRNGVAVLMGYDRRAGQFHRNPSEPLFCLSYRREEVRACQDCDPARRGLNPTGREFGYSVGTIRPVPLMMLTDWL